jgi:adenylate kinase
MNLIIFGAPGSGKGTQAELLSKELKIPTLSMGELFRQAYDKKTSDGIKAYDYWGKGKWVPGKLTFKVLKPFLARCSKGFILDGYPRRKDQIPPLEKYLKAKKERIDKAILLLVSDQEAIKRLLLRAEKARQTKGEIRFDDTKKLIKARLNSHHQTINPIINYFRERGNLLEIDGERSIEAIYQDIIKRLRL